MRWSVPIGLLSAALTLLGGQTLIHPASGQAASESSRGPKPSQAKEQAASSFQLLTRGKTFILQVKTSSGKRAVKVPRDWLIPPKEENAEEGNYVSSFSYGQEVTPFPLGDGDVGLHFSSYEMNQEGSAHAAAGRDVFLIYEPRRGGLGKARLALGITKGRLRAAGCWTAWMTYFIVADIDGDGLNDLGVVKEKIFCDDDAEPGLSGPFYEQEPARWYLHGREGWKLDSQRSGVLPERHLELPPIGVALTPVDFVGMGLWHTFDPSGWKSRGQGLPKYMPSYRRELIRKSQHAGQ